MAESFAPEDIVRRTRGDHAAEDAQADAQAQPDASRRPAEGRERDDARALAVESARLCNDRHCEEIVVYDVGGVSPVTDFVVIASGTSDRQVRSVGHEVADLARRHGFQRMGTDRDEDYRWFVVDFGAVMVHLFEPVTRGHYDLEMLWGDAASVKWRRPAGGESGA